MSSIPRRVVGGAPMRPGGPTVGDLQRLPIPPGTILTDLERREVARLGADLATPIPPGLAERIDEVRRGAAQLAADSFVPRTPVPLGTPPLQAPRLEELDSLPPERQQELRNFYQEGLERLAATARLQGMQLPEAGPGLNEAIRTAAAGRPVDVSQTAGQPHWAAPPGPPAPRQQPPPPPAQGPAPSPTGAALHPTHCQRCGWDLALRDDIPAEAGDRLAFQVAWLGGQRFRKEYLLLGGRCRVGFRSLTAREGDMAVRQVALDANHDAARGLAVKATEDYWRTLMGYRVAMALDFIQTTEMGRLDVEEIGKQQATRAEPPNTPVHAYFPYVFDQVLQTEYLRQAVGFLYQQFWALEGKLALKASDPDFWKATGEPR